MTLARLKQHDISIEYEWQYDDVIKWKHFPRYWPFVRGIHRSPVNSPHRDQWRRALMFSLTCARINGWINNREAGDLRRHRAHDDVTVMNVVHLYSITITSSKKSACDYFIMTLARLKQHDISIEYEWQYDDVIKWKHFPRYWPFVRGIHRSPVNSPHRDQWRRALMFSLTCARINGWINNREAGDLRRHRAHDDVTVMNENMVSDM